MPCQAKHTKYQPTDEEFKCPQCGAPGGEFYIAESPDESDPDCTLLHPGDYLACSKCEYGTSAKSFAASLVKKNNLTPCTHCKGTGLVKKSAG